MIISISIVLFCSISLFCLVIFIFLAWASPEGEEIPGVGFVEKKRKPVRDGSNSESCSTISSDQ